MVWTEEARAKASKRMSERWKQGKLGPQAKKKSKRGFSKPSSPTEPVKSTSLPSAEIWVNPDVETVDLERIPLPELIERFMGLEKFYKLVRDVVVRRQSVPPPVIKCYICHNPIEDGKWLFKDDEPRDPKTGAVTPRYICREQKCLVRYNQDRPIRALSRH